MSPTTMTVERLSAPPNRLARYVSPPFKIYFRVPYVIFNFIFKDPPEPAQGFGSRKSTRSETKSPIQCACDELDMATNHSKQDHQSMAVTVKKVKIY